MAKCCQVSAKISPNLIIAKSKPETLFVVNITKFDSAPIADTSEPCSYLSHNFFLRKGDFSPMLKQLATTFVRDSEVLNSPIR